MQESDDDLMKRVAVDDGRAFAVLVERHEAKLRLYLARLLPRDVDASAEARELAQDVFVDVWRARARYEPRGFFLAWLLRMARSRATSRGRALQVRRLFAWKAAAATTSSTPPIDGLESVLAREDAAKVRAALASLPAKTREAVTLRFTYGLEPKEIAEVLGVDAGAVRVRLHRGLQLLRERVGVDVVDVDNGRATLTATSSTVQEQVPVLVKEGVR